MNKKTVRAGIVGAGFSASFHFEAIEKVHGVNVEIKGVYALEGAQAYAEKHEIAVYDSLERLLDDVDVIHCCATASAHEPIAIAALERNKFAIVEKPLTGFFGDGSENFNGETFPKEKAQKEALASIERMLKAEKKSKGRILYAENWIYAPSVQKEREIIEKTGAQVLWIHAEEAHSGSHAKTYAYWKYLRRRRHDRQGLPPADGGPVPQARRGQGPQRQAHSAQDRHRPHPRPDADAELPRRGPHPVQLLRH